MIGDDTQLVRDVIIQEGVKISSGSRISPFTKVTCNSMQIDNSRLKTAMRQMGGNIRYDQIGTWTSLEGVRCVRAQVGGVWLPSQRVSPDDSLAFGKGTLTLRELADKYIAPVLFKQSLAAEGPSQGIKR